MRLLDERIWLLFRCHLLQTLTYWSVFFSFGLCIAFLGPTILDLRCQTQSTLQQITWVFFWQQFFLLVGSSVGGLFKKTLLSSLSALFASALIISLVFAVIPLCHHVILLSVAMGVAGAAMGVIDTIGNLQLVRLYQKDSAVFLQALHFFIGLGALVSPLVVDPFLAEDSCVLSANRTANSSGSDLEHLRNTLAGHGAPLHNASQYPLYTEGVVVTRVSYAFWIMAVINLPVPAAVLALMIHERLVRCCRRSPPLLSKKPDSSSHPTKEQQQGHGALLDCCSPSNLQGHPATFFIIHALGGAIVFITDGIITPTPPPAALLHLLLSWFLLQGCYAGFVYTYAVSPPLLMGYKAAGCLDSVFWASITAGRLCFIFFSYRYAAPALLSVSLVGVILVQLLLLIFYSSRVFLFMASCVLGLCISSVFPSMLAFTEDVLDYKGSATIVLVTSASTGEMLLQLLVGSVIHSKGSYSFLLCTTITSFIGFCLFLLLLYTHRVHRNHQTDSSPCLAMKDEPKIEGS
ncbi:major facilitator superfamily domain-containing protein 4A isoform X1 [Gambusia affinis]|uniref:major facilitator superfamily domain-containing protein 4A isoform X1 n=1 Tax=Gambusia affinis TaxID=33528 RepID=UPI001CDCB94A|nr:major facilitator superfamily domain-containing protein 4A isoform X1 [Gambusia affinis]